MSAFVALQKVLPQKVLTELAGRLADIRWKPVKNFLIKLFMRVYQVDMAEAKLKSAEDYLSFNQFFTRELVPNARPISSGQSDLVSPADGVISELGHMHRGSLIQAKGILYSARELLVNDILAAGMDQGSFITVYLSPKDYHRVHVPFGGRLLGVTYVPGQLFSVNDETARSLDGLFTRNERIVAEFATENFSYALVMVGAMIVGGMETVVTGPIVRQRELTILNIGADRWFQAGEEFGRFHLGSTAIVVLPKDAGLEFRSNLQSGSSIKMGECLGSISQ